MELTNGTHPIQLLGTVEMRYQPGSEWATAGRPFSVFGCRMSGTATFDFGGRRMTVGEGEAIYIPAHIGYRQASEGERIIALHFLQSDCTDTEPEILPLRGAALCDRVDGIYTAWHTGDTAARYRAQGDFFRLLSQLSEIRQEKYDPRVTAAVSYLRAHLNDPEVGVAATAAAVGVSETLLRRLMHRDLGMAPARYLSGIRMEHARELLLDDCISVSEVAARCGFSDVKYFRECFRAHTGMTAGEWRRHSV